MDLWQVKRYMCLLFVTERCELQLYFFIVEEREFVFTYCYALCSTGVFVEFVVIAQIALVEHLVYSSATLATKGFVGQMNFFGNAIFTAVIALNGWFYTRTHNRLQIRTGVFAAF